nr:venom protein [Lampona murina]
MWKLAFYFILVVGAFAEFDNCVNEVHRTCAEKVRGKSGGFPVTQDEFDEFCGEIIAFSECTRDTDPECVMPENALMEILRKAVPAFKSMCDKESILYQGIVQNLKCIRDVLHTDETPCEGILEQNSEILSELLSDEGDEGDDDRAECLHELTAMGCVAAAMGVECGEMAKDVAIEIARLFDLPLGSACTDNLKKAFPVVVEVIEAEIRQEEELENTFRKK